MLVKELIQLLQLENQEATISMYDYKQGYKNIEWVGQDQDELDYQYSQGNKDYSNTVTVELQSSVDVLKLKQIQDKDYSWYLGIIKNKAWH